MILVKWQRDTGSLHSLAPSEIPAFHPLAELRRLRQFIQAAPAGATGLRLGVAGGLFHRHAEQFCREIQHAIGKWLSDRTPTVSRLIPVSNSDR